MLFDTPTQNYVISLNEFLAHTDTVCNILYSGKQNDTMVKNHTQSVTFCCNWLSGFNLQTSSKSQYITEVASSDKHFETRDHIQYFFNYHSM
jgi:hypothetical protein